jgi:TM2 domain-containing membrane protein YozV
MTEQKNRSADEKFCGSCGEIISAAAASCPQCGAPQAGAPRASAPPAAAENPAPQPTATAQGHRIILGADEHYCASCGSVVKKLAELCPSCGVRQIAAPEVPPVSAPTPPAAPAPTPRRAPQYAPTESTTRGPQYAPSEPTAHAGDGKNKWLAIIFAFFLGGFGAHKFYLGKYAQGFIYLILFWTLIPSVIAFIEMLVYLFTPQETFSVRYPKNK